MPELLITARDPIIARDGRPFQIGQRVRSLDWIYPSVFIGSLRTLLGKQLGYTFNPAEIELLKRIELTGPLPHKNGKLFFPKPLDYVVNEEENKVYAPRPVTIKDGEGCNLPTGLLPVLLPDELDDFKPKKTAAFWSWEKMSAWLGKETVIGEKFDSEAEEKNDNVLNAPEQDERVHVKIKADSGSSEEGMLFSTTGLDMADIQIAALLNVPDEFKKAIDELDALHPLGGERRLVHWKKTTATVFPPAPKFEEPKIKESKLIRMVLTTPAIFSNGYLPGWIDKNSFDGTLPDCNVKVKLIGAIVDRWRPLSGWSYEAGKRGPKPVRRLVPAGSVYFFEVQKGSGSLENVLDSCWLKSVCDEQQDRNDGFGLVLWGVWTH
jgi:CRISPR-associated protein Cmr3